jgi:hypothetical protein
MSAAAPQKDKRLGKSVLESVFTSATSVFLLLIVAMANYLAFRHYERFDWTSEGVYTLSDKSKSVIKGLKQEVTIYLFMSQNEGAFEDTNELLARYKDSSPHVKVRYVDPDREPGEFKVLSQRFGVEQVGTEMGESRADVAAVVSAGDKKWHISRDDLVGFDFGNMPGVDNVEINIKAEQALTGALVQVMSGRATRVCVTRGHGEISLDDQSERSIASLKTGLRHDNLELEPLDTLGKTSVPKECDAVLVLGPQRAFAEAEAKLLIDHVQAGGRVLLALDPVIEHDVIQPTGFEAALEALSIRLDRSLAIELSEDRLLSPNTVEFLVTEFGQHETTGILRGGARVLVSLARSFSLLAPSERVEVLMRTSDKSFAATDIARILSGEGGAPTKGAGDVAGPIDLALAYKAGDIEAVEDDAKGGRLILIGDSDFLQGPLLEAPELANFHLMSAFIGHLVERKALVEIPAKKVKGGTIMFTQEDLGALLFRVGVLIPGAAFLLGLAVWLNRRS